MTDNTNETMPVNDPNEELEVVEAAVPAISSLWDDEVEDDDDGEVYEEYAPVASRGFDPALPVVTIIPAGQSQITIPLVTEMVDGVLVIRDTVATVLQRARISVQAGYEFYLDNIPVGADTPIVRSGQTIVPVGSVKAG